MAASLPEYPFKPAKEYAHCVDTARVRVAGLAMDDENEQRTWFGVNLRARGYTAIAIVIENVSADDSLILRTGNIRATFSSATPQDPGTPGQKPPNTKPLMIASFAPVPYGLAGSLALAKAKDTAYNLTLRQLRDTTISPGQSARGFLLLALPKAKTPRGSMRLMIPFELSGREEIIPVTLDL